MFRYTARPSARPSRRGPWLTFPILLIVLFGRPARSAGPDWAWLNPLPTGATLSEVWRAGPGEAFVVGDGGTILRITGTAVIPMVSHTTAWLGEVWGFAADDVFAVGGDGAILHYDGSVWTHMVSPTTQDLYALLGSAPNDLYAGGWMAILHYDGAVWSETPGGWRLDVWGTSPSNVFVVGSGGSIRRYDGAAWAPMASGTGHRLFGVWGNGDGPGDVLRSDCSVDWWT